MVAPTASVATTASDAPTASMNPSSEDPTSGLRNVLGQLVLGLCISGLCIAAYDKLVRQPSTPRLAVVDVAKLYAEAERVAKQQALENSARTGSEASSASAEFAGTARVAVDFGPTLEQLLRTVSSECHCAIVAMAAVYGSDATVPDFTADVAQRLRRALQAPGGGAAAAGATAGPGATNTRREP